MYGSTTSPSSNNNNNNNSSLMMSPPQQAHVGGRTVLIASDPPPSPGLSPAQECATVGPYTPKNISGLEDSDVHYTRLPQAATNASDNTNEDDNEEYRDESMNSNKRKAQQQGRTSQYRQHGPDLGEGSGGSNNNTSEKTALLGAKQEGHGLDPYSPSYIPLEDEENKPAPTIIDRCLNAILPPGSIPASSFNLCAATLGAGTLGLPYAMDHTGVVVGSLTLVLCGAVTVYTCDLLILTLEKTGFNTYEKLSANLIGPRFEKAVAFLIVAFCWGVACVYVVVVGSIIEPMQVLEWLPQGVWGDRAMTSVFWLLFMLPLSNLRDINSLRYASLVGFLATFYLVLAIVLYAALEDSKKPVDLSHKVDLDWWSSLTVFSFSYCCQTNIFEVYHELKDKSPTRMKTAAALGMTFCTSLYIISGVAGLAAFGHGIESNILSNFKNPQNTLYVVFAFVCITFTVTLAFPVAIFPTRDAVLQLLGYRDAYHTPPKVRYLVCTLLAFSALVLGLFVPNIQILFSILGGICGSSLGYCLPVVFAWKAGVIGWDINKPRFILAWVVCCVGGLFGIIGTLTTIIGLFQKDDGDSSSVNPYGNSTNTTTTTTSTMAPDVTTATTATKAAAEFLYSSFLGGQ